MMEDDRVEGLRRAVAVLRDYHERHRMGVNAVIQSEWARGVFSGRGESINILEEEIRRLRMETEGVTQQDIAETMPPRQGEL